MIIFAVGLFFNQIMHACLIMGGIIDVV